MCEPHLKKHVTLARGSPHEDFVLTQTHDFRDGLVNSEIPLREIPFARALATIFAAHGLEGLGS